MIGGLGIRRWGPEMKRLPLPLPACQDGSVLGQARCQICSQPKGHCKQSNVGQVVMVVHGTDDSVSLVKVYFMENGNFFEANKKSRLF